MLISEKADKKAKKMTPEEKAAFKKMQEEQQLANNFKETIQGNTKRS